MSIGLGEAGDDVDMFVPVGGDQDGVSEGVADVVDGGCIVG